MTASRRIIAVYTCMKPRDERHIKIRAVNLRSKEGWGVPAGSGSDASILATLAMAGRSLPLLSSCVAPQELRVAENSARSLSCVLVSKKEELLA
jgi:hypothetical protein